MSPSDVVFGVARGNAPPKREIIPETEPVTFYLPEGTLSEDGKTIATTYAQASIVHYELGQRLAKMLRERG